jgi:putative oxidoreductase
MSSSTGSGFAPKMLSIMRIIVGFMFCQHGFQKILGFFGGIGGTGRTATFPTEPWFAGMIEMVGGILILIGLFTPIVAFLLSGEMAVAYFTVHFPRSFWTVKNAGEPAVLSLSCVRRRRALEFRCAAEEEVDVAESRDAMGQDYAACRLKQMRLRHPSLRA